MMKIPWLRGRRAATDRPSAANGLVAPADRTLQYERGSRLYATDGRVGTLTQVVVDETAGEVTDLIVQVDNADSTVLLPPDLVERTVGSAVFVSVNRAQFAERTANATRVEPHDFAKANTKALRRNGLAAIERNPRRAVLTSDNGHVETLAAAGTRRRAIACKRPLAHRSPRANPPPAN